MSNRKHAGFHCKYKQILLQFINLNEPCDKHFSSHFRKTFPICPFQIFDCGHQSLPTPYPSSPVYPHICGCECDVHPTMH